MHEVHRGPTQLTREMLIVCVLPGLSTSVIPGRLALRLGRSTRVNKVAQAVTLTRLPVDALYPRWER